MQIKFRFQTVSQKASGTGLFTVVNCHLCDSTENIICQVQLNMDIQNKRILMKD